MSSDISESEDSDSMDAGRDALGHSAEGLNSSAALTAKEAERLRIQEEVEAFLRSGGKITRIDSNVMSDPPKAPESNYGGQPI